MHVKLFWKNNRPSYKDGTIKRFSFRDVWKRSRDLLFNNDEWRKNLPKDRCYDDLAFRRFQELEVEIDTWLSQNPTMKVVDIKQSAGGGYWSPSHWLISVWYEEAA
jgi:hypothetical protein